jgi:hypothetical protein
MRIDLLVASLGMFGALGPVHRTENPIASMVEYAAHSAGVSARNVVMPSRTVVATHMAPIPAFARRENMSCDACHTTVPRLNRFGYEYRNAGFRMPNEIGEDREVDIPNMISARIQATGQIKSNNNTMSFKEFTLYPASGSFGKHWSALTELSFGPEDVWEIENAYIRGTFGKEEDHFQFRVGVFHPFEGYGGSDRPLGLSRPLFQTTPASNAGVSTFFKPWGFDQVGLELGYTHAGFNATAAVFNGIYVDVAEAKAFPFQGGNLSRPGSDPNHDSKDFRLLANQFISLGSTDAAITGVYYHGTLSVPYDFDTGATYTDNFDRFSLYGTLPMAMSEDRALWLMGGAEWGTDGGVNPATGTLTSDFSSNGWFGEAYLPVNTFFGLSTRYTYFRPTKDASDNARKLFTVTSNLSDLAGLQAILEYQYKTTDTGPSTSNTSSALQLRLIMIM